ncbi:hypothetical protein TSH7_01200 [Azospirillum sp. TSH7]|nr:hypothetical protein TSH7_01200 [Azospirillum sp. TSH7]PWC71417.1 hypothetical protein TSH20_03875 [Azospirillum sp. TSH20]
MLAFLSLGFQVVALKAAALAAIIKRHPVPSQSKIAQRCGGRPRVKPPLTSSEPFGSKVMVPVPVLLTTMVKPAPAVATEGRLSVQVPVASIIDLLSVSATV